MGDNFRKQIMSRGTKSAVEQNLLRHREVEPTKYSISPVTVQKLRATFARLGIPETVVTDNGPWFARKEFEDFFKRNGITHTKTALVERACRACSWNF